MGLWYDRAFKWSAIVHVDHRSVSHGDILANSDGCAFPSTRWTEVIRCSFNRNRTMILRVLHTHEGRFSGASRLDAMRIWYYICKEVMGATMESAITVKGQATIPRAVRKHLGLKPGDRVKFFMHPDGSVVLLPKLPASALRGIVKSRRRRPVTIEEMTDVAREGAAGVASRARRR
jgi:antitoxin PrlF